MKDPGPGFDSHSCRVFQPTRDRIFSCYFDRGVVYFRVILTVYFRVILTVYFRVILIVYY